MCKQFRTLNSSVLPVMKCASPAKVVFNALQLAGENGLAFNRLKVSIAPLIGYHPSAKTFVILTTA